MNEVIKTILSRRSVRKYRQEQIKKEELEAILEAGSFAPSAMNQQPWHFTVVQNKEMLNKINEACISALIKAGFEERIKNAKKEYINIMHNAPTLIIVSGKKDAQEPVNDCSLALGNMLLAAESLNIGSCWIHGIKHLYASEEGKTFLTWEKLIPEGYAVVGSGIFGYKAATSSATPARKENIITII